MIGPGLYFDLLCMKLEKYRNIKNAKEISISLSIFRIVFGNIDIVINFEIFNIAQLSYKPLHSDTLTLIPRIHNCISISSLVYTATSICAPCYSWLTAGVQFWTLTLPKSRNKFPFPATKTTTTTIFISQPPRSLRLNMLLISGDDFLGHFSDWVAR
jgi:hypothetical protein